ncbi:hypothetical protein EDD85DRAFT_957407 [Armillaria nabsnona]|nr:hypothetical protein EDD85DRAFT_957407 [Armillaria nabsnona]
MIWRTKGAGGEIGESLRDCRISGSAKNQHLAARINANVPQPVAQLLLIHSRATTSLELRTGSTSSITSSVTMMHSVAVKAPTTRSASKTRSASPSTPSADDVEVPEKKNVKVGYKNIPSLDAITARLAIKICALSIDGSTKPPEAEMIDDPMTPGVSMKVPEHPLPYLWTIPRYQSQTPLHTCLELAAIHRNRRYLLILD